jgi:hypothetical protein
MSSTPPVLTDAQKTARAMAAVDAMATTWAMTFELRRAVNAMMRLPDGEDRLVSFIKQSYAEGLFVGRTSHQSTQHSAELAALLKDANDYCRILSLLGMEEEGDPVAEVERLRQRLNDANKCVGQWIDAEARLRTTLGVENAALRAEIATLRKDAQRYRFLRAQPIEGEAGQPVIALPNGMKSGYYLNEETADFAADKSIEQAAQS